jgi:Uncharacterized protein conserved in bacteria (DUF2330)
MTITKRCPAVLSAGGVLVAALLLSPPMSPCAYAFGGLWSSQAAPVKQAGEEILFVDNPGSTITAVVQITYDGPAQKFAWVIPMPGRPTVGVSSSTVFQRLDAATAPEYWREVTVEGQCAQPGGPDAGSGADSSTDGATNGGSPSPPDPKGAPVIMIDRGAVGPYDYATVTVDPTLGDPSTAATAWLTTHGYDVTSLDHEVLTPYLRNGLNLLAFKLTKGAGAGAIRPVILTYESKLPMIPMRPTSVAAHDDMGIKVWVVGPSRAVPENTKSLVIDEVRIDWLTAPKFVAGTLPAGGVGPFGAYVDRPSHYDAAVTAAAHEAGGQGFVTELARPASQYRDKIWSPLDDREFKTISSQPYPDGIDAILAATRRFGGWDGWKDALRGATTLPDGVTIDEFERNPGGYRGAAKVVARTFFQLLDERVLKPVAAAAAMLFRAPYLTRLYSTMSASEMTVDPIFDYDFDLAQVSNVHIAEQIIECSVALTQDEAPWRITLPQGGEIVGKGRDVHAIGGTQAVSPYVPVTPTGPTSASRPAEGNKCSVSRVGAGTGSVLALASPVAVLLLALVTLVARGRRRPGRRDS